MLRLWSRWQDWGNLVLGAWLFISPWVLGVLTNRARWDFWLVGAAIFVVSLWLLGAPRTLYVEWINALLAVWLFISPWVLRFATRRADWNAWAVGIVVFLLAMWASSLTGAQPPVRGGRAWRGRGWFRRGDHYVNR